MSAQIKGDNVSPMYPINIPANTVRPHQRNGLVLTPLAEAELERLEREEAGSLQGKCDESGA